MTVSERLARLAYDDKVASALLRGLSQPVGDWGELLAEAQGAISIAQERHAEAGTLLMEEEATVLIAAARILSSAAEGAPLERIDDRAHLALMAAAAHAMYGNMTAASALVRGVPDELLTGGLAVAAATISPRSRGLRYQQTTPGSPHRAYLEALEGFLCNGTPAAQEVMAAFIECVRHETDTVTLALLRSVRVALIQVFTLSVRQVLGPYVPGALSASFVQHLIDSGHVTFLPPQYRAIRNHGLIESGGNTLIALPTSTGKTLLAELALRAALRHGFGLAVYVSPYVALGSQVAARLQSGAGRDFTVHRLFGGYGPTAPLDPGTRAEILVATPEAFDGLLRAAPELIQSTRAVAFDEAHILQSGERGLRLEGLLTRLRLAQKKGSTDLRLIVMSAVMGNFDHLLNWLDIAPAQVVTDTWRPTARRLAVWRSTGALAWLQGDDPIATPGTHRRDTVGSRNVPWPEKQIAPTQSHGLIKKFLPLAHKNVAYLVELMHVQLRGPVLCACATRAATRGMARAVAARFEAIEPLPNAIRQVIALIQDRYLHLLPMVPLLERGVAYHNASLPKEVRARLEECMAQAVFRVVTATTTLAEGVDLPFRSTVLADWMLWSSKGLQPMPPLTFRNIAGRCGRAGTYVEGDTIIFDNPLGPVRYTAPNVRSDHIESLLNEPRALRSAVTDGGLSDEQTEAVIGSQVLAAVGENSDLEDLPGRFVAHSYAAYSGSRAAAAVAVKAPLRSILGEDGPAFAVAASPLRLTALGEAVNKSGLSPQSARRVLAFLGSTTALLPSASSVGVSALVELSGLPEVATRELGEALKQSTRFPVRSDDFAWLIDAAQQRAPLTEVFAALPYTQRSRRAPTVHEWLGGIGSESWDSDFDKFVQFMVGTIGTNLPWLFRACGTLSASAQYDCASYDWDEWAVSLEDAFGSTDEEPRA